MRSLGLDLQAWPQKSTAAGGPELRIARCVAEVYGYRSDVNDWGTRVTRPYEATSPVRRRRCGNRHAPGSSTAATAQPHRPSGNLPSYVKDDHLDLVIPYELNRVRLNDLPA
jgi:hypothetical protein